MERNGIELGVLRARALALLVEQHLLELRQLPGLLGAQALAAGLHRAAQFALQALHLGREFSANLAAQFGQTAQTRQQRPAQTEHHEPQQPDENQQDHFYRHSSGHGRDGRLALQHRDKVVHRELRHGAAGGNAAAGDVGREHQTRRGQQRGVDGGLALKHIQPGGTQMAAVQGVGKRGFVHHAAAGDVDQRGAGLHLRQLGRTNEVIGGGAVGQRQQHMPTFAQQLGQLAITGAQIVFEMRGQPFAIVIEHAHIETMRCTPRNGLADATHADDAQRGAMHIRAGEQIDAPFFPLPRAQIALGLAHLPGRGQQQGEAEIGGGLGEHVGRVGDGHAALGASGQIDVIDAHGHGAHDQELRAGIEQGRIDALAAGDEGAVLVGQALAQRLGRGDGVVGRGFDFGHGTQRLDDVGKHGARHQHAQRAVCNKIAHRKNTTVRRRKHGIRTASDQPI